jgi:signal transduction histidine kinase/predicted RNA-binding protein with RPS1 domain/response regulator of citrate/malate metabolism
MAVKSPRNLAHVRVIKHLPQGLSVAVENGEVGIIRSREISWNDEEVLKWKASYPVGWEGYAFTIPAKKGEVREFSLRLMEKDPWDEFSEGFDKNRVFEGTVTGVFEYGVFIEIVPGMTGLLHKSHIPSNIHTSILDLFWYGDKVFVTIRDVDYEQRQIGLSLAPPEHLSSENPPSAKSKTSVTDGMPARTSFATHIPRRHILVVEDEISQSEAVCGWLRELGQSVDVARTAEDALAFLAKASPNIVLIDVGLPVMSGTDLARNIQRHYEQVQVVIATDWARANEVKDQLDELQAQGGKLLYKPLLPEDLESYLLYEQDQRIEPIILQEEKLSLSNIPKMDARKSVQSLLATYKKHLGVEQVILFSLDPARRSIHIVDRAGEIMVNKNAVAQLIYSPVRDAAEDRKLVIANEINEREQKRFQYLLEFSPMMISCIGVPVPAQSSMKYAMFALDRRANQFGGERQMYTQGMALAIGAALDQIDLRERSALMQRSALIGNLASGMMHEINNLVSPLLYESNALRKKIAQVEKDPGSANASFNDHIVKIQQDVRKIINTTKSFGRATAKGRDETLRVDEIIEETLNLLRDISENSNVMIHFFRPDEMLVARTQSVVLEQIILNVTLNAIQQIAEFRPGIRGWIKISMQVMADAQGGNERCRVLVEDNGPGVHAKLWDKIFDAGYSTRREGSGIGLYISRNLIQEIGGEIYVSKSHILSGTTFVLEFPVHL